MFFYFAVFAAIATLSILSLKDRSKRLIFSIAIGTLFIFIAGFKQPGIDFDSETYLQFFNSVGKPSDYFVYFSQYSFNEAGYYLLPAFLKTYFNAGIFWFFLIIAMIAIPIKITAIWRLTEFQILSILIYFCDFFILHEMTQVRQGIASGILLLALPEIERKNLFRFCVLILIGCVFHYSTLLLLPFFFLNTKKLNKPLFFSFLIIPQIFYLLKLNFVNLLVVLHLGILSEKLSNYNDLVQYGIFTEINIYNALAIFELLFCSFLIWKSDYFQTKNKYSILMIKIYTIGISSFALFYNIPVISFRISGFLNIVEIILIPFILYYIEEKIASVAFVILLGLGIIYLVIIHAELLKPYEINSNIAFVDKPRKWKRLSCARTMIPNIGFYNDHPGTITYLQQGIKIL